MENEKENIEGTNSARRDREEIFSKAVRAGKRTYFFDVKATKGGDYYMTITESKKRFGKDGQSYFEKHKIFLYKEDFDKFTDGLKEIVDYIKENNPISLKTDSTETHEEFSEVEFDDLEKK